MNHKNFRYFSQKQLPHKMKPLLFLLLVIIECVGYILWQLFLRRCILPSSIDTIRGKCAPNPNYCAALLQSCAHNEKVIKRYKLNSSLRYKPEIKAEVYFSQKQLPRKMKQRLVITMCAGYIF